MKKITLSAVICTLIFYTSVFAQKANTDSLALVSRISANQLKLGNLQNEVDQKTKNKLDASEQAQKSANENSNAANKLTSEPNNRKLARQANNAASDAKSDSRAARKEERRLNSLNKDIADMKDKIAEDQRKLDKLTTATPPKVN